MKFDQTAFEQLKIAQKIIGDVVDMMNTCKMASIEDVSSSKVSLKL